MFGNVAVGTRSIDEYRSVTSLSVIEELRRLAAPLEGVRVLHLSSPAASAAVRGILQSSVPLMVNLGVTPDRGTLCVDKAREMIGYEPRYPIEEAIPRYVEWYRSLVGA